MPERDDIARLVDTFYDRVRRDPEIGPVFNAAVHDWPAHFGHRLALWRDTAHEVLGETDGEVMYGYARRIGQSLRYGLGFDALRPPGSRLPMHPGG